MTTPYIPSIVIDSVIDALGTFLQPFAAGAQIIQGQGNRTPMPAAPCIVLTPLLQVDLETPIGNYDGVNFQVDIIGPARIDIQIDFYGPSAGDQCKAVKGVYRSSYSTSQFPDGIKPLYCSDGLQAPFITAEQQYESHWILTASLQYNPVVAVPLQSADTLAVHEIIVADYS